MKNKNCVFSFALKVGFIQKCYKQIMSMETSNNIGTGMLIHLELDLELDLERVHENFEQYRDWNVLKLLFGIKTFRDVPFFVFLELIQFWLARYSFTSSQQQNDVNTILKKYCNNDVVFLVVLVTNFPLWADSEPTSKMGYNYNVATKYRPHIIVLSVYEQYTISRFLLYP